MSENDDNQSFLSHLEALRNTLLKCIYSIAVVLPFTFYFSPKILESIINIILSDNNTTLNYFSPTEVFLIQIKTAFFTAVIICFPYIAKQLWDFILPALYENEKRFVKTFVILSTCLFLAGSSFCLFVILPLITSFGMSFAQDNIRAMFGISNIMNLALWLCIIFGLVFQIPVITYRLIKSGTVSYETFADKRPYVIVILLVISGILTPPDIVSQILLAFPAYMLFEAGLFFAKYKK